MTDHARRRWMLVLRLLVSAAVIAFIVTRVDLDQFEHLLPTMRWHLVLAALAGLLAERYVVSYRWELLLVAKRIRIPFGGLVKVYFLSGFLGTFLPSSIAPDFVRVWVASRNGAKSHDVLSSVIIDRVIGLYSLLLMALFALLALTVAPNPTLKLNVPWQALAVLAALALGAALYPFPPLRRSSSGRGGLAARLWEHFLKFYESCESYKSRRGTLLSVLLISLVNQSLAVLVIWFVARSLGAELSLVYLFLIVPVVSVLVMIPISLGGLGVQEGAYAYLFTLAGLDTQLSIAIALLFRALTLLSTLPGAWFYSTGSYREQMGAAPRE
ncbi:MAG: lysylphosphatidylglycerol synthase transmembrane domain-containing protein [Acidobacteriota bacterium]